MNPSIRAIVLASVIVLAMRLPAGAQVSPPLTLLGNAYLGTAPAPMPAFVPAPTQPPPIPVPDPGTAAALMMEQRASTVSEAIAIKTAVLSKVHSLSEFRLLINSPFKLHSGYGAYGSYSVFEQAVSAFAAEHVHEFVNDTSDLDTVLAIEGYATSVDDAIAVKRAGMKAVHSISDLEHLTRSAFVDPSAAYVLAVREFSAQQAPRVAAR